MCWPISSAPPVTAAASMKAAARSSPTNCARSIPATQPKPEDDLSGIEFQPVLIDFDLGDEPPPPPDENVFTINFKPKPSLYAKANETALILRELAELGTVETSCDISDLPLLSELDPEGAYLSWMIRLTTTKDEDAVRDVFDFVSWDCDLEITNESAASSGERRDRRRACRASRERPGTTGRDSRCRARRKSRRRPSSPLPAAKHDLAEPATPAPAAPVAKSGDAESKGATATIRVDLDRVDRLIDLVGELVINQAMLAQRVTEAGLARASGIVIGLDELEQLTREIQDSVMAIRAQPVKSVFQRMPRLVRELAAMTGKSVRLVTDGENTEVDKTVIERLADPLTHMIRNAIDHGLEKPEARIAAGKPEEGTVRLSALHRSGRIVIEVSDDGAGINRPRVRADRDRQGPDRRRRAAQRRGDRQSDLPAGLFDRIGNLRHFRPRRRHGRGEALDPGARRPHLDLLRVPATVRPSR